MTTGCCGRAVERVVALVGVALRLDRLRLFLVWKEPEGGCSAHLRLGPDDLSVFRLQLDSSRRSWSRADGHSLFCETLT